MSSFSRAVAIVFILAVAAGAFTWWRRQSAAPTPNASIAATRPVSAPAPSVPAAPGPSSTPPAILHPISPTTGGSPPTLPSVDDSDGYVVGALTDLLGRKNMLSALIVDNFARHFVATVNNLATENAAAEMWPVIRTGGSLKMEGPSKRGGGESGGGSAIATISGANADRYAPFVTFISAIDTQRAVNLYKHLYPLFQRAYEDLGFPDKYFNDRVIDVIDHLLATPEPIEPLKVKAIATDAVAASARARTRGLYVFADPALESSSSGQKILLRIGRAHAATLKAKLIDVRRLIATGP